MKMNTKRLVLSAVVAAVYAVMGYFGNIFGLTFGPVQCRFAEALCVLPFFFPDTAWGLFIGCAITNLVSAYGPIDIIFGSLATLASGLVTARIKSRLLVPLPSVLINAVVIGAVIAWAQVGATQAFVPAYVYNALTIGIGQALACYGLGTVVLRALPKIKFFRDMMPDEKKEHKHED